MTDRAMARRYPEEHYSEAQLGLQLARMRTAAERLVSSEQTRIEIIAAALLRHGTLSGDQIIELTHDRNESLSLQSQW